MVADEAGSIGSRQEREDALKPHGELRDRHIRAADEAVARADNRADRRRLSVGGQEEIDARRQRRTEQGQEHDVQNDRRDIGKGQIPPLRRQIQQAGAERDAGDNQRGERRGEKVRQRKC